MWEAEEYTTSSGGLLLQIPHFSWPKAEMKQTALTFRPSDTVMKKGNFIGDWLECDREKLTAFWNPFEEIHDMNHPRCANL